MMILLQIKVGDRIETVRFFHCYKRGVDRVFVDHPMFVEKVSMQCSDELLRVTAKLTLMICFTGSYVCNDVLPKVWGKTKSKIYGPDAGTDYQDNQLRFSLLCQVSFFYVTFQWSEQLWIISSCKQQSWGVKILVNFQWGPPTLSFLMINFYSMVYVSLLWQ